MSAAGVSFGSHSCHAPDPHAPRRGRGSPRDRGIMGYLEDQVGHHRPRVLLSERRLVGRSRTPRRGGRIRSSCNDAVRLRGLGLATAIRPQAHPPPRRRDAHPSPLRFPSRRLQPCALRHTRASSSPTATSARRWRPRARWVAEVFRSSSVPKAPRASLAPRVTAARRLRIPRRGPSRTSTPRACSSTRGDGGCGSCSR